MESRIVSYYDYKNVDLSKYIISFVPNETIIADELNRLVNRSATWSEGTTIKFGDMATLDLESSVSKFNKNNVIIGVGSNLFSKELEKALLGMSINETKVVKVDNEDVKVKVIKISSKEIPALTDDVVKKNGPEEVNTIDEYREYLINQQKEEILSEKMYDAEQYLVKEMFDNTEFVLKKVDWERLVKLQLDRNEVLANQEGMSLKTMTKDDYKGRIPVESYDGLVALLQYSTWEYLYTYVIGKYYAEKDMVDISENAYEKMNEEYCSFWGGTIESARLINTYEKFVIDTYCECFYKRVRGYIRKTILREGV